MEPATRRQTDGQSREEPGGAGIVYLEFGGEVTGGVPEVGLGDPGPCVPAPASWLWRGRKLGRFSGGPRP